MDSFQVLLSLIDFSWIMELLLLSLAWVIVSRSTKSKPEFFISTCELFGVLFAARCGLFLLLFSRGSFFAFAWSILHGLIGLLFLRWKTELKRQEDILLWLTLYNTIISLAGMSGQASYLYGLYVESGFIHDNIRIFFYLFMLLMAWRLRSFRMEGVTKVPTSAFLLDAFVCFCIMACSLVESFLFGSSSVSNTSVSNWMMLLFYSCMLITSVAVMQVLYTICREQAELSELRMEQQRYRGEREVTRLAETTLEDLRCIRHDLKNQYSYLQMLIEGGRFDELRDYFREMQEHLPEQLSLIDCGNSVVNTTLNMELSKLRAKGLSFDHQLVVPPVLPFQKHDICSILTNLLDNAAEECSRLKKKGSENLKIRLEIYPHQSYLYIRCLNSTDLKKLNRNGKGLATTKPDATVHGFGTKIVSNLAERYNGCVDYHLDNGLFVAQVMLDMTESEEKHEN